MIPEAILEVWGDIVLMIVTYFGASSLWTIIMANLSLKESRPFFTDYSFKDCEGLVEKFCYCCEALLYYPSLYLMRLGYKLGRREHKLFKKKMEKKLGIKNG